VADVSATVRIRVEVGLLTDVGVVSSTQADAATVDARRRRVHEIDGVRGWAALSVLLFHFFWSLFGTVLLWVRSPLLHFWLNGPLAVYIFFVLSGDALSWPFVSTGDSLVLSRSLLKRYFRLAIPIFYSCLIAYVLMRAGLTFNHEAAAIVPSPWLSGFLSFTPSLASVANFSFSQVFFDFASYPNSYNRFLWPMPVELAGSFLVFGFCYGVARRPQAVRLTAIAAIVAFMVSAYYSLFLAGLAFALLRQRGVFDRLRAGVFGRFFAPALIVLAIALDTVDSAWGLYLNDVPALRGRLYSLLATMIVFGIYCNSGLIGFFSNGLSRWIGKLSFPIYLLHFAVVCSLTSYLIVRTSGYRSASTYAAIGLASVAATFAAAWVFERLERYSLGRVDRVVRSALDIDRTYGVLPPAVSPGFRSK
jgi:peptidoglycan/LPS O-acetylase OafA/YrhL